MALFTWIAFGILCLYSGLLLWLALGFLLTRLYPFTEKTQLALTIIICARNEENTIRNCLLSIVNQEYDFGKVQLILVDDASSDETIVIAREVLDKFRTNYKILSNATQQGKKASIIQAISIAENELLVIRDADTVSYSSLWLQTISDFKVASEADLIIGPLQLESARGLIPALQAVENNVLTVLAGGSCFWHMPFLASGANLIYTRSIFQKVNGFASHALIPSGDDVLFLEEVRKAGGRIAYLKSRTAIASTFPLHTLRHATQQRVRWAAKFKVNSNPLNLLMAAVVLLTNLTWIAALVVIICKPWETNFLLFIVFKILIDLLLLFLGNGFVRTKKLMRYALPLSLLYPFYAAYIGIASMFLKPRWKN